MLNMAANIVFASLVIVLLFQPIYTQGPTASTPYQSTIPAKSNAELEIDKLRNEIKSLQSAFSYLQQKVHDLDISGTSPNLHSFIAFEARLTSPLMRLGRDQIVRFDHVLMNKGNGYDARIGVFRCPLNGTYQLSLSIACFGRMQLDIAVNGVQVGHLFASQRRVRLPISTRSENEGPQKRAGLFSSYEPLTAALIPGPTSPSSSIHGSESATSSTQFLLDLVVGDDVWVRHLDNGMNAVLLSDTYTTFNGHLLHAE